MSVHDVFFKDNIENNIVLCALRLYWGFYNYCVEFYTFWTILKKGDFFILFLQIMMTKCNVLFQASKSIFSTHHMFFCFKLNENFAYIIYFLQINILSSASIN